MTRALIVAAAIKVGDLVCSVPKPGRHHTVIRAMAEAGHPTPIMGEQGFVTDNGVFVDRVEGLRIALEAGQTTSDKHKLFSEDVW